MSECVCVCTLLKSLLVSFRLYTNGSLFHATNTISSNNLKSTIYQRRITSRLLVLTHKRTSTQLGLPVNLETSLSAVTQNPVISGGALTLKSETYGTCCTTYQGLQVAAYNISMLLQGAGSGRPTASQGKHMGLQGYPYLNVQVSCTHPAHITTN